MNEEEINHLRGELAKGFWQAFEYGSPKEPWVMAKFVLTWFGLNGYEIRKKDK